jgi:hypothetical protein
MMRAFPKIGLARVAWQEEHGEKGETRGGRRGAHRFWGIRLITRKLGWSRRVAGRKMPWNGHDTLPRERRATLPPNLPLPASPPSSANSLIDSDSRPGGRGYSAFTQARPRVSYNRHDRVLGPRVVYRSRGNLKLSLSRTF